MIHDKNDILGILKNKGCRRDEKGRLTYSVPTAKRRSGRILIPNSIIKELIKEGKITKEEVDANNL